MALHKISDTTLRALKASDKTVEGKKRLDDGGGLYLLLEVKGGGRAWRFDYTIAGKRKTISLGTYPDTTLARQQADAARKLVAGGNDPSEVRKAKKAGQKAIITAERREANGLPLPGSFEEIAREWYGNMVPDWSDSHASRTLACRGCVSGSGTCRAACGCSCAAAAVDVSAARRTAEISKRRFRCRAAGSGCVV